MPSSAFPRRRFLLAMAALLAPHPSFASFQPGRSYFGEQDFIEYLPGDLPLVISAPHGGREEPEAIPTRESGVRQMDMNTQELARQIAAEVLERTGRRAHLVICRLHRGKLDCNREIEEGAAGNAAAEKAWSEYHGFIETALAAGASRGGKVFYIDLHGQAHKDRRIELGYLHSRETLARPESVLNSPSLAAVGSLRRLAAQSKTDYVALLRGPQSLAGLLESRGFPCTPSPERPVPNVPYFQGGYSVRRHVSSEQPAAGLQVECNFEGLRDTAANRGKFAAALVPALREFLAKQWDLRLPSV